MEWLLIKLFWHMFYIFLSFGFGYGLWLKGQTFDCGRSWKLSLRFYTAIYQILFSADGEKTAEEEDEDLNGTRQLKKYVGFLFSGLEQEFEESKSARAKLRERIKKVKTAIKEADDSVFIFFICSLNLEWADLLSSNSCSRPENRNPTSFFNCPVPFRSSSSSSVVFSPSAEKKDFGTLVKVSQI